MTPVQTGQSHTLAVREADVSRHNGALFRGPVKPLNIILLCDILGDFKGAPKLGTHDAERR